MVANNAFWEAEPLFCELNGFVRSEALGLQKVTSSDGVIAEKGLEIPPSQSYLICCTARMSVNQ